jgi:hypothetical protein
MSARGHSSTSIIAALADAAAADRKARADRPWDRAAAHRQSQNDEERHQALNKGPAAGVVSRSADTVWARARASNSETGR